MAKVTVPKSVSQPWTTWQAPKLRVLKDPVKNVRTSLTGSLGGILTDSGVPGQTPWDISPPPTTYQGQPLIPPAGTVPGAPPKPPAPPKPGYMSTLTSDPLYIQALGRYNTMLQQGRDTLRNQIRNAVIQSGYIPDFSSPQNQDLQGYADDLDAATLATAQGSQTSQKAQLGRQYQQNLTNLDYDLASRGSGSAIHGGANVVGTGLLKDQFDLATNQQMGSLLDALRGNVGGYQNLQSTELGNLTAAQTDVAQRLASIPGAPVYDDDSANMAAAAAAGYVDPNQIATTRPVTWGGQQFTTKAALTQFLKKNPYGISASRFAALHPTAWARLT